MKKIPLLLATSLVLVMTFILSCSSDNNDSPPPKVVDPSEGTLIDERDEQSYKWVKIGEQYWMAENLKFAADGSKCGDESNSTISDTNTPTCDTYGRLYNWETAMNACPSGWHLPDNDEWNVLIAKADDRDAPATKLKANSDLWVSGKGTDDFGFAALPGGAPALFVEFSGVGTAGYWWTSTESDASFANFKWMQSSSRYVLTEHHGKSVFFSVRCVKD